MMSLRAAVEMVLKQYLQALLETKYWYYPRVAAICT